jgi:hypothetical protein
MRKVLAVSAKDGTEAKDKRRLPFGNRGRRGTEAYTNYHGYVERKRSMKPPEKTLSNYGYRKLLREGLEKMIEMEKEKLDQQSMLR